MEPRRNLFGLSAQAKALLIEKLSSTVPTRSPRVAGPFERESNDRASRLDVTELESFREIRMIREAAEFLGIADPFFRVHEGIAGAETEIAKLQSLKQKLDQAKDDYWAKQVEVQRLAASGILAHAQGDNQKAVELVRAAADLDASMDKHPATPAEVLPAREVLADLLLELNQPAAALKEYEQTVSVERNRFRSILGIARAAKQTGDTAKAREAYGKLVAVASADSDRPELAEAKAFLAN